MQTVVDWVNRRGGAAAPAHPYQAGMVGRSLGDRVLQLKGIAAIETLNGSVRSAMNDRAQWAARQLGLQGIGGSDAHGIQALGNAYTCFADPIETEAELAQALHTGRYTVQGSSADNRFQTIDPQLAAGQDTLSP
jgi:predicted metal-dependent phosphoesterase TrpH